MRGLPPFIRHRNCCLGRNQKEMDDSTAGEIGFETIRPQRISTYIFYWWKDLQTFSGLGETRQALGPQAFLLATKSDYKSSPLGTLLPFPLEQGCGSGPFSAGFGSSQSEFLKLDPDPTGTHKNQIKHVNFLYQSDFFRYLNVDFFYLNKWKNSPEQV